jgi:hypothetical protein
LFPGRRNVKSKAVCETRITSSRKTEIASRMMTCLRCEVLAGGIKVGCATGVFASRRMSRTDPPECATHYRCTGMVKAAPSFIGNRIRDPGPTQALALTVGEGLPDGGFLTFSRPPSPGATIRGMSTSAVSWKRAQSFCT